MLWPMYDPATPRGFYLNKGIFYFGQKVENAMAAAEQASRKNRKAGTGTDKLANAARLKALEDMIGIPIKRHKDPGNVTNMNPFHQGKDAAKGEDKDESTVVMRGF